MTAVTIAAENALAEDEMDSVRLRAFEDDVKRLAQSRGLYVVNALFEGKPAVTIPETMTSSDFVDLIIRLGAKWLTTQRKIFDPEEYGDHFDAVSVYEGEVALVRVTWMVDGVLYRHEVHTSWYDNLLTGVTQAREDAVKRFDTREKELAALLEADPGFRGLPSHHQSHGQEILTEHLTDEDYELNWQYLLHEAVKTATANVKSHRVSVFFDKFPDEQGFIDAAKDAGLPSKLTIAQRTIWVRKFLMDSTGGYHPPTQTVEQFEYILRPGWVNPG